MMGSVLGFKTGWRCFDAMLVERRGPGLLGGDGVEVLCVRDILVRCGVYTRQILMIQFFLREMNCSAVRWWSEMWRSQQCLDAWVDACAVAQISFKSPCARKLSEDCLTAF